MIDCPYNIWRVRCRHLNFLLDEEIPEPASFFSNATDPLVVLEIDILADDITMVVIHLPVVPVIRTELIINSVAAVISLMFVVLRLYSKSVEELQFPGAARWKIARSFTKRSKPLSKMTIARLTVI